ncbi:MAG: BamA/TamA family outer membrane protein [Bacteroidales bacterium]
MKRMFFLCFVIFISLGVPNHSFGQDSIVRKTTDSLSEQSVCPQMDIFDILTRKKLQAPEIPSRKVRAIILPLVAYSPVTGFQLGAGSSVSWTIGQKPLTKLSAGSVQLLWTTEKQLISYVRTNMFFNDNKWFLQTDWRWYVFRMPTYGLGTGPKDDHVVVPVAPGGDDSFDDNSKYYMRYNWVRLHNILLLKLTGHFYAGVGYHFDHYYDIHDDALNLDSTNYFLTPHYTYSLLHGYNPGNYTTSGVSFNVAFDSRDNIINAYKGVYVNINYLANLTLLGSTHTGSRLWTEFRTYIGLSRRVQRHLLAFWLFGNFQVVGTLPYLNLMSNGFDQMNSSGRGYPQGRWRGEDFVYGEVEYRFPISRCTRIVGGVLFANVSSASGRDNHVPLFGFFKPGCGFGLRIMVGKHDRTNILVDFGIGQMSSGFYLQAQEIF